MDADYRGRVNAAGAELLDIIQGLEGIKQNNAGYRVTDEIFNTDNLDMNNVDEVLGAMAPRTKVFDEDMNEIGGDQIRDSKGRINLDKIRHDDSKLSRTVPDEVNSDTDPSMKYMLYPEQFKDGDVPSEFKRAHEIGKAMQADDTAAYRRAGMPISVTREAAEYVADHLTKGKNEQPIRSTGFVVSGGLGSPTRSQILIPGTDKVYAEQDRATQTAYKDQRNVDLVQQYLGQGMASIGNPSQMIIPPGEGMHMDHVRSLSSSIDTVGQDGWGYSDELANRSYLDRDANVHSKLNYGIGAQHTMMRQADDMRREGEMFPARLSRDELKDKDRVRLSDDAGIVKLITSKQTDVNTAGKRLLDYLQYRNRLSR